MEATGRALILAGLVLLAIGALLTFSGSSLSWLGRLPGDLRIERPGVKIYLPITTSILLSAVLSLVIYLLSKLR
jgi:hypothetical protein